ncbi:hypothetical protein DFH29DRAFT_628101 [Suillus ampliporus]|nr:hypothetical protein DFH29DRAFT_628101 [Suillus ampliporus]
MRSSLLLNYLNSPFLRNLILSYWHPPISHTHPSLISVFHLIAAMSFNTAALYGYPQIPPPYPARHEPLPPRRPRASTMTQDTNTQWGRDAHNMPGLDARSNFQPPALSGEYFMWNDVEVQNDWAMAAREQERGCRLQVEHSPYYQQRPREHKEHKRVSFDTERGRRGSADRERGRHVSLDRQREHRASVDREREHRASIDRNHDLRVSIDRERCRCMSIGRHYTHESVSRTFPRPPVSAVSFKPPTTGPRHRASVDRERDHRTSVDQRHDLRALVDRERCRCMLIGYHHTQEPVSRTFPRPPVSAISFKPPITGPQPRAFVERERDHRVSVDRRHDLRVLVDRERCRCMSIGYHHIQEPVSRTFPRPPVSAVSFKPPTAGPKSRRRRRRRRRSSFDYTTVRDYSHGRQHPVHVLPPPVPTPPIHFPARQRDRTSVEAVRRIPFPSTEVPRFEKSTKPSGLARFNPFKRVRTASMSNSQDHSNRLRRKTAGRA